MNKVTHTKGFTLLEVLLVIGLIAILAGIVIVAINPARQISQANNTQREADVNTILNAVYQYMIDNEGELPGGTNITTSAKTICTDATATCVTGGIDLFTDLVGTNQVYLVAIPKDPAASSTVAESGYTIEKTAADRITVAAPNAELSQTISVTR
jgi:prepilin-type N-terminal cleavage/methylation domain-containing protein